MTSPRWGEGRFEREKCFVIEFHYFVRPNTPNIVILSNIFLLGVFLNCFFFTFPWQQFAIRLTQHSSPAGFDLANSILATNSRGCEFTLQYSKKKKKSIYILFENLMHFPSNSTSVLGKLLLDSSNSSFFF